MNIGSSRLHLLALLGMMPTAVGAIYVALLATSESQADANASIEALLGNTAATIAVIALVMIAGYVGAWVTLLLIHKRTSSGGSHSLS